MRRIMAMVVWALSIAVIMGSAQVKGYKNHTVGDTLGWYDNIEKPTLNYGEWAQGKNFSLGDFLIFNTDTNHTVIQTYNATTYKACDYDDAEDDDTIQWSNGDPSATAKPVTVSVPLVREGVNYFFSSDYDGWQCSKGGQKFQITVAHGQGLPPGLLTPPPAAPADDPDSAPVTDVPATVMSPVPSGSASDDVSTDKDASHASRMLNRGVFSALGFLSLLFLLTS